MITFHKPEELGEPGDVRFHVEVLANANNPEHDVKPCPFCGCQHMTIVNTHTPVFVVQCDKCGVEMHGKYYGDKMPFKSRPVALRAFRRAFKSAVDNWNTRFQPPMQETLVWRYDGKPDEGETVFVQTSEHEVDAAFVEEGEWLWACGARIPGEVVFGHLSPRACKPAPASNLNPRSTN
jgi:ribosomal protein L37AE/L43A